MGRHRPWLGPGGPQVLEATAGEGRDHRREILAGLRHALRIDAVAHELADREQQAALAQIPLQRPQSIGEADHQTDLAADLERSPRRPRPGS